MNAPTTAGELPAGLAWEAGSSRLKVRDPALAELVLRDPHIITGVDHGKAGGAPELPGPEETPSITRFFELWYTVGADYPVFNTELRKVFTTRAVAGFADAFTELAARQAGALAESGDLARDYLSPYFMNSTFAMLGVPQRHWSNLTKVAKLVNHLFKQQLLGVAEHSGREQQAFGVAMGFLKSLTDELLTGAGNTPFLRASRALAGGEQNSWPIAALIGQLLMAGIEPMIVGSSMACLRICPDAQLRAALRDQHRAQDVAEEILRQHPPFRHIFRFVAEPCDCLGPRLEPGTIVAIDIGVVNLHQQPAQPPAHGCPVRPSSVLTFGKGTHYCLGANSARLQVATALHQLVLARPELVIDEAGTRIDTGNNLTEVRSLPYSTSGALAAPRKETR